MLVYLLLKTVNIGSKSPEAEAEYLIRPYREWSDKVRDAFSDKVGAFDIRQNAGPRHVIVG